MCTLHQFCVRRLALPPVALEGDSDAAELVRRALAIFGAQLVGVLLYGSWMRGEATDRSDVDALVVLEEGVDLTRALYRSWDAQALAWAGRVLFEREGRVSAQLTRVRRDIVDGRLVRRMVHGQGYWRVTERSLAASPA